MPLLLSLTLLPLLLTLATHLSQSFLTPLLSTLAARLQLTHELAGVTLLALGNGAPDLCATIAATRNEKAQMAVGELIGAAAVIWCAVVGCVVHTSPSRPKSNFADGKVKHCRHLYIPSESKQEHSYETPHSHSSHS